MFHGAIEKNKSGTFLHIDSLTHSQCDAGDITFCDFCCFRCASSL